MISISYRLVTLGMATLAICVAACREEAPKGIQVDPNPTPQTEELRQTTYQNPPPTQQDLIKQQELQYLQYQENLKQQELQSKQRLQGALFNGGLSAISGCLEGTCSFTNILAGFFQNLQQANVFGGGAASNQGFAPDPNGLQ